ncbi:MAG: hypothetical protein WB421_15120 [Terriglobales bacterium]|jgi:hypothetical protein
MKLVGLISAAFLSLTLGVSAPVFAQEQHDQQEEQKDKPAEQKDQKTQPEKPAKQEEKTAQQDKNANQEEKTAQQQQHTSQAKPAQHGGGGRIPDDRYRANFGQEHRFRVTQANYRSHRFQYGGYSFGFVDAWPSNWLYTQDVYVIDIDGVYYLCNPMYPGVNVTLSITL